MDIITHLWDDTLHYHTAIGWDSLLKLHYFYVLSSFVYNISVKFRYCSLEPELENLYENKG